MTTFTVVELTKPEKVLAVFPDRPDKDVPDDITSYALIMARKSDYGVEIRKG